MVRFGEKLALSLGLFVLVCTATGYLALATTVKPTPPEKDLAARVAVLEVQVKELRQVVGLEGKNALDEGLQHKLKNREGK